LIIKDLCKDYESASTSETARPWSRERQGETRGVEFLHGNDGQGGMMAMGPGPAYAFHTLDLLWCPKGLFKGFLQVEEPSMRHPL